MRSALSTTSQLWYGATFEQNILSKTYYSSMPCHISRVPVPHFEGTRVAGAKYQVSHYPIFIIIANIISSSSSIANFLFPLLQPVVVVVVVVSSSSSCCCSYLLLLTCLLTELNTRIDNKAKI